MNAPRAKTVWGTAITLYCLGIADYILTLYLLSTGNAYEGNPIMDSIIVGPWGLFLKVVLFGIVVVFFGVAIRTRLTFGILLVITAIYGLVVAWNLSVLLAV